LGLFVGTLSKLARLQTIAKMRDANKRVASRTAEHTGEDGLLIRLVLFVDPRFQRDEPFVPLVERCVDRTSLGNELVQLERENRVAETRLTEILVALADPEQKVREAAAAFFDRLSGFSRELRYDFANAKRLAPNELILAFL